MGGALAVGCRFDSSALARARAGFRPTRRPPRREPPQKGGPSMTTRAFVSMLCAVCLVSVGVPSWAECTLNAGIQQAQEGEYASAITSLRCVVDRLVASPQAKTDLKSAYIYLGVSYLGLDQEADAQRALISALKLDPALQLKTTDFPPR